MRDANARATMHALPLAGLAAKPISRTEAGAVPTPAALSIEQ